MSLQLFNIAALSAEVGRCTKDNFYKRFGLGVKHGIPTLSSAEVRQVREAIKKGAAIALEELKSLERT